MKGLINPDEVLTCWGAFSAREKLERAVRGAKDAQEDALEGGGVSPGVGLPQLLAPVLDARLTLSARPRHGEMDTCFNISLNAKSAKKVKHIFHYISNFQFLKQDFFGIENLLREKVLLFLFYLELFVQWKV